MPSQRSQRLLVPSLLLQLILASAGSPQRLIVDTDMGFDVDDVVAVVLANTLHTRGEVDLLAVVHDTGCELGIGGVSAMNHFYGHDNVTLGAWKGKYGSDCNQHYVGTSGQNQYLSRVIDNMGGPVTSSQQVMLGTDAYRKVLATAPNASVNIASIGMPTNLADLLGTKADQYSALSGYDLLAAKVNKIVMMDGMYNFGCAGGNIGPAEDCYGRAQAALKMPPSVKLVFSSKGASPAIYTGGGVPFTHPVDSPIREALDNWCCSPNGHRGNNGGRLSWDPITVMIAALDVGSVAEKETDCGTQATADPSGEEHFFGTGTRNCLTNFTDTATSPGNIRNTIDWYIDNILPGWLPNTWIKHSGANCYGDRDGHGAHGASNLENPPSSAAPGSPMTLAACEEACLALEGCTGITVAENGDSTDDATATNTTVKGGDAGGVNGGAKRGVKGSGKGSVNGLYNCYRKGWVNIGTCDHSTSFDTYSFTGAASAAGAAAGAAAVVA